MSNAIVPMLMGCPYNCVDAQVTSDAIVLQILGQVPAATELQPIFHQNRSGKVDLESVTSDTRISLAERPGGNILLPLHGLPELYYHPAVRGSGEKPRGQLAQLAHRRELLGSHDLWVLVIHSNRSLRCNHFPICVSAEFSALSRNELPPLAVEKYNICFFYTTYTISLFAGEFEEQEQVDVSEAFLSRASNVLIWIFRQMLVGIVFTLIGFGFKIWLIAQTYMCLRTIYGPSVRFQENRYQLQKFLLFKRVSKSIQARVMKFYDFSFKGKFYRKSEINALVGKELSYLVTKESFGDLLRNNYFFKSLPAEHLNAIANCMSEVFFLSNDVICRVDSTRSQVRNFQRNISQLL